MYQVSLLQMIVFCGLSMLVGGIIGSIITSVNEHGLPDYDDSEEGDAERYFDNNVKKKMGDFKPTDVHHGMGMSCVCEGDEMCSICKKDWWKEVRRADSYVEGGGFSNDVGDCACFTSILLVMGRNSTYVIYHY